MDSKCSLNLPTFLYPLFNFYLKTVIAFYFNISSSFEQPLHGEPKRKARTDLQEVTKAADKQLPLKQRPRDLAARFLALLLTLAATIIVGINKETKTITVQIADDLPSLHLPITAKWQYMSAFIYFVDCNAIAYTFTAVSLAHSGTQAHGKNVALATHILDTVMIGLLFSANGAPAAIGNIARHGNSHVHWDKVCNVFNDYCRQMVAALVLSLLGSFEFLWLAAVNREPAEEDLKERI